MAWAVTLFQMSIYNPNTLGDELTKLAIRLGVQGYGADGKPTLPTAPTYDRLLEGYLEAANDFWRRRTWAWACPEVAITVSGTGTATAAVDGSATTYALPFETSGQPLSARAEDDWRVGVADAGTIRQALALHPSQTGAPEAIAIDDKPLQVASPIRGRVLVLWPKPDREYVVTFRVKRAMATPRDLTDELFWGEEHCLAVFRMALLRLKRMGVGETVEDDATLREDADAAYAVSVELDQRAWGSASMPMRSPKHGLPMRRTAVRNWVN